VALSGGIFILPFFFLSPLAGQIADKHERSHLVRLTKYWELLIMLLAAVGFYFHAFALLLFVLFLAGVQATLFGPLKYSLLPDLVAANDLVEANAYVEAGTFLAILLGTIAGGALAALPSGASWIGPALVIFAVGGILTGIKVPSAPVAAPDLKVRANPLPGMLALHRILKRNKLLYHSIVAISWFWFFGAAMLSILPLYCKNFLHVQAMVVTLFLAMFTIGIAVGSWLCARLSFHRLELGHVLLGALGLSAFLIDLSLVPASPPPAGLMGFSEFWHSPYGRHVLLDFFLVSVAGGFFTLPLYTILQVRSLATERSRIIAANNIMNAIFMVFASVLVLLYHAWHWSYPRMFQSLAVANSVVVVYLSLILPDFRLSLSQWWRRVRAYL
jgi:MFS family permease